MSATDHEPQDDVDPEGAAASDAPPPPDTLTVPLPLDEPSPGLAADFAEGIEIDAMTWRDIDEAAASLGMRFDGGN